MALIKAITTTILILCVILALAMAVGLKGAVKNPPKEIMLQPKNNAVPAGFEGIQVIEDETSYTVDGTFQALFKVTNNRVMTIGEVTVTDPLEEEDCLIITKNQGITLAKHDLLNITARCTQKQIPNPYKLNLNITYTLGSSKDLQEELGTIKGKVDEIVI